MMGEVEKEELQQSGKKAGPVRFSDLSVEIKSMIVEHVHRPTDLKALCLASKQLHEIAVKTLYHTVAFDLGSPNDGRISAFLNPRNIGLPHVRRIRLYLANVMDRCNQEQQAHFATRMMLEFMPENTLEEFRCGALESWCPWKPFSADNLLLLYKKQKKLKWLEVMMLDRALTPAEAYKSTCFDKARKLALYPENRQTLETCHFCIEKTAPVVEDMILHANFESGVQSDITTQELNDTATAPGLLTSTLFSHMLPFDACTPFANLKSLRLHRISLRYCSDSWCKVIDFTKIQYLRLFHCVGSDALFGQLCKSTLLPQKLKVLELQHKDNAENETLQALDGFLCLVSGIEDLIIDMESLKALPAAAGIARHGKTLELLNVHASKDDGSPDCDCEELVWSTDDFEKIATACTRLEQLSCAWPRTHILRDPSDDWKSFENSCGSLRDLVTLHVTTWPTNKPASNNLPRDVYEWNVRKLAQRGFELAVTSSETTGTADSSPKKPSKLNLIAFGISDKIYDREDSKHQLIYIRNSYVGADHKTKVVAEPIGWCLRQYVEPRSEVLDFVLGSNITMPCRDYVRGVHDGDEWDGDL